MFHLLRKKEFLRIIVESLSSYTTMEAQVGKVIFIGVLVVPSQLAWRIFFVRFAVIFYVNNSSLATIFCKQCQKQMPYASPSYIRNANNLNVTIYLVQRMFIFQMENKWNAFIVFMCATNKHKYQSAIRYRRHFHGTIKCFLFQSAERFYQLSDILMSSKV